MDPVRYPCSYEGGFKGMRSSPDAVLELSDEQFSVSRPKTLWARTYRIWAKWTAVTGLTVTAVAEADRPDADESDGVTALQVEEDGDTAEPQEDDGPRARVALTTRARGTGVLLVPYTSADELWDVLHGLADLAERFERPADADEGADANADRPAGDDGSLEDSPETGEH